MSPEAISGLSQASSFLPLISTCIGVFVGLVVGMIPGMTISTGIIVVLPVTFVLPADISIALLLGLYVGGMTGGSFSQRSSSLSFGRSSDQDEAEPLRRRLLELGESLVACRREESKLAQLIEQQKPQLRELEKQQAALIAERNAARRNHGPLLERSRQRAERLSKLQQDQTEQQERLEAISTALNPLTAELQALDEAERNSGNNDDAAAWAQLQNEQEAADQRLEAARSERDQLLNARRERQLAIERLGDQEKALAAEETRLQQAVKALASAVTIGTGGSAGQEGPVAQVGAGVGSTIARALKLPVRDRRLLLLSGGSAGVGAMFCSPLGGALFMPEVLYKRSDLEADALIPCIISSIFAYATFTTVKLMVS